MATIAVGISSLVLGVLYCMGLLIESDVSFAKSEPLANERQKLCGPVSLAMCAQLSGRAFSPETIIRECTVTPYGVSTGELRRVANVFAVDLVERECTWDELTKEQRPVILHLWAGHFVVANPSESDERNRNMVRIYDPNGSADWWSKEATEAAWSRRTLTPYFPTEPQALKTTTWWLDVGRCDNSAPAHFQVPIESVYDNEAVLRVTGTSCACTDAAFDMSSVSPGRVATLRAGVILDGLRGPFRQHVFFISQCGETQDEWCLTLAGTAVGDVDFSTREIALGNLSESRQKHAEVIVRDPGDGSLTIVDGDVMFENGHRVRVGNIEYRKICEEPPAALRGRHPIVQRNDWIVSFDVVLEQTGSNEDVAGKLRVSCLYGSHVSPQSIDLVCPIAGWAF